VNQILLVPAVWCTMLSAMAQEPVVSGRIVYGEKPVPYASVSLGKQKGSADSAGYFRLPYPSPGRYKLKITAAGFAYYETEIILPAENPLLVPLKPAEQMLEDIVITGTMKAVRRLESPVAVEVYTPQFFKKNPAPSIFESLQHVNGVRPQLNCNVCNTGDIHINGLEGPYTMITIDGMPIVSGLSSVYGLFGIPTQMIERVEIVKGPASGLYGSEAVGGLINIITKSAEKAPAFTADWMSTSWQEHSFDAGTKFSAGKKMQSLLGVNYYNYQKPADKNGDHFTDVTLQHRISVFNKISFLRKKNRTSTLAARYFYEDRWGGETHFEKKFRGTDSVYGESIYTSRWELIGNYRLPVEEDISLSVSATAHSQNSYYGTTAFTGDQKILFGQLLWNRSFLPGHHSLLGLTGRYNYYDDNSTVTRDTLTKENKPDVVFLPGIFVQDEWSLSPAHTLLTGFRYDHHPVHGTVLTPRIAYKFTWHEKNVLRLNAGTGFRVVNLFTEEHAALTGARAVEITEALKPEKSYNINLNYNTGFKGKTSALQLDFSVWYSYFNNQILPDYDTDPDKIIYRNLDGYAVSKGITLNIEWNLANRLKLISGLTGQDVSKFDKRSGRLQKESLVLTEKWSGTWAVSYRFPAAGITIDYTGNVYGPMRLPLLSATDPRPASSPVWSLQNIQFTKRLSSRLELFTGIKNLLNWTPAKSSPFLIARADDPFDKRVQYDANGDVLATTDNPYALTFDPSYVYAPNQGIRVFGGIRYTAR